MTWLRLDDGFPEHPKVVGLTDAAFRLEVSALCYAHRNITDGLIPEGFIPRRLARSVPALEAARLWVPSPEGGWLLNDYLAWQSSRAAIEEIRDTRRKAGAKGARARWQNG
jgi:hypothetical protein